MYYFVIGADGSRYGPADIDTLVEWVHEGRIVATTILIERGTERELRADSITAIAAALRGTARDEPAVTIERGEPAPGKLPTAARVPERDAVGPGPPPLPPVPPGRHATPPIMPYARPGAVSPKSRIVAGLLGIFLGALGIHRFYLGYTGIGLLMLFLSMFGGATSFLLCIPGSGCGIIALWGFVEGIICLCGGMRDAHGLELRD